MKRDITKAAALIIGFAILIYAAKSLFAQSPTPTATQGPVMTFTGYDAVTITREYQGDGFKIPDPPTRIIFSGGIAGNWLTVERHNKTAPDARGFDPSYVSILSDFKPVVSRQTGNKWIITFESELDHGR